MSFLSGTRIWSESYLAAYIPPCFQSLARTHIKPATQSKISFASAFGAPWSCWSHPREGIWVALGAHIPLATPYLDRAALWESLREQNLKTKGPGQ